jgi:chaperonin GroES
VYVAYRLLPYAAVLLQVLAIGADVKLPLAVGDKVVFQKYAMAEVEVPDGDILFVAEKSIMGKLE